jgi:hypothetical protein
MPGLGVSITYLFRTAPAVVRAELRHTHFDHLPNEDCDLHRSHNIHHPSDPPTQPPLVLLLVLHCMPLRIPRLRIIGVPLPALRVHVPVLERNRVLVCKRICTMILVVAVVRCVVLAIVTCERYLGGVVCGRVSVLAPVVEGGCDGGLGLY